MRKSIVDISWNVSEEEYREDPSLHYSIIAKFDREGFRNISKLFDKVESPSLSFGSAVDTALTCGIHELNDKFLKCERFDIPDSLRNIVMKLYILYGDTYNTLHDIPEVDILAVAGEWQPRYRPETKLTIIKGDECDRYYRRSVMSKGKVLLDTGEYDRVLRCVTELKTSPITRGFFEDLNPDRYETAYQLKFKATYGVKEVKCMIDRVVIDHKDKTIELVDLKTTSGNEEDFEGSFLKWRYNIQAQLYTYVVDRVIMQDEYFSNFTIKPFIFVVINKYNLSPIVWRYKNNYSIGDIVKDGKTYKNFRKIIPILVYHLTNPFSKYPIEIENRGGILDINV